MISALAAMAAFTASPSIDAFFADFVAQRERIQTITATFRQENVSSDETKASGGRIVFTRPRQLLFEYLDPKVIYAIDGQRVFEYEASLEQVQVYDVEDSAQADAFFIAFDANARRLREAYDVTLVEDANDGCSKRMLKLVPKKSESQDDSAHPYREIRLYLRDGDLLPCRIHAITDEESSVIVDIDHYKVNEEGAKPTILFHVPEGTKIIVNETDIMIAGPGGKDLPGPLTASPKPADK